MGGLRRSQVVICPREPRVGARSTGGQSATSPLPPLDTREECHREDPPSRSQRMPRRRGRTGRAQRSNRLSQIVERDRVASRPPRDVAQVASRSRSPPSSLHRPTDRRGDRRRLLGRPIRHDDAVGAWTRRRLEIRGKASWAVPRPRADHGACHRRRRSPTRIRIASDDDGRRRRSHSRRRAGRWWRPSAGLAARQQAKSPAKWGPAMHPPPSRSRCARPHRTRFARGSDTASCRAPRSR